MLAGVHKPLGLEAPASPHLFHFLTDLVKDRPATTNAGFHRVRRVHELDVWVNHLIG
jgi:hypothetical protein